MSGVPPEYDYVAYIDESGDPGLSRVKPRTPNGASEWFVLSGVLVPAELEHEVEGWVGDMMSAMNSHQLTDIHFSKLTDNRKALLCANKQNMQGYKNPLPEKMTALLPQDNWFYCWMTRVLLERITDYVAVNSLKKRGEVGRVKLEFSERGGLRYSQMKAYYEFINIKSAGGRVPLFLPWGFVDFRTLHPDIMHVYSHRTRPGLKLPDITASAFFRAVDIHDTRDLNPSFAKLLKPRVAADPVNKMLAGYGVKLMPNMRALDRFRVPESQREILKFYGYPRQWWQRVVDPGPV
jgi:hypothetical protein